MAARDPTASTSSLALKRTQGFTLIELSIVLVIIGLVVGGILVGQDLIASATLRSVMSQQERIQAAVNTFRTKFNCIPGDCLNATDYGFANSTSGSGTIAVNGNGDGIVGNNAGYLFSPPWNGPPDNEPVMFWMDLFEAGMINQYTYPGWWNGGGAPWPPGPMQPYGIGFPAAIRQCNWQVGYSAHAGGWPGYPAGDAAMGNVLSLVGPNSASSFANGGGSSQFSECLTPYEASSIDTKLDDGMPFSGAVQAGSSAQWIDFTPYSNAGGWTSPPDQCVVATPTTPPYAPSATNYNYRCNLLFKISGS